MKRLRGTDVKKTSSIPQIRAYARYGFSVSRFHVPQGRSKIAQRFIAGLWREHNTSPVRDERAHRSSPIFSVAPPTFAARQSAASARRRPGLGTVSTRNPRLKPWATFGRPYRDFGIRALPLFNMPYSRREGTEHITRAACAGPTFNTYSARQGGRAELALLGAL